MWNMRLMVIPNIIGALGMIPQRFEKETGVIGNQRKNQDNPDHSTV